MPIPNGTPQPNQQTAQTMTGHGPDVLSVGQGAKLAFAPNFEEALKYVKNTPEFKTGKYKLIPKVDSEGNDIVNAISDLYLVDKDMYDKFYGDNAGQDGAVDAHTHNDYLEGLGTRVSPGIVGNLAHGVLPTAGSFGGLLTGSALGLGGANPATVGVGAIAGNAAGSGLGEMANQALGNKLFNTDHPYRWKDIGLQALLGGATEGLLRGAGNHVEMLPNEVKVPLREAPVPVKAKLESVGETLARKLGKVETAPMGKTQINVSKLTRGTPQQEVSELAQVNSPIQRVFQDAGRDLESAKRHFNDMADTGQMALEFGDIHGPIAKAAQYESPKPTFNLDAPEPSMTTLDLANELKSEFPRMFGDMEDDQIIAKLNNPAFFEDVLKQLRNRFTGGRASGLSWEDVMGLKPRQLVMLKEMAAKRGRGDLISPETSAALENLSGQLGDLQATMTRSLGKGRLKGAQAEGFYDPKFYAQRGFENVGAQTVNPLAKLLYERLSNTSSNPKDK